MAVGIVSVGVADRVQRQGRATPPANKGSLLGVSESWDDAWLIGPARPGVLDSSEWLGGVMLHVKGTDDSPERPSRLLVGMREAGEDGGGGGEGGKDAAAGDASGQRQVWLEASTESNLSQPRVRAAPLEFSAPSISTLHPRDWLSDRKVSHTQAAALLAPRNTLKAYGTAEKLQESIHAKLGWRPPDLLEAPRGQEGANARRVHPPEVLAPVVAPRRGSLTSLVTPAGGRVPSADHDGAAWTSNAPGQTPPRDGPGRGASGRGGDSGAARPGGDTGGGVLDAWRVPLPVARSGRLPSQHSTQGGATEEVRRGPGDSEGGGRIPPRTPDPAGFGDRSNRLSWIPGLHLRAAALEKSLAISARSLPAHAPRPPTGSSVGSRAESGDVPRGNYRLDAIITPRRNTDPRTSSGPPPKHPRAELAERGRDVDALTAKWRGVGALSEEDRYRWLVVASERAAARRRLA
ncbi:hypothetical protein T484DRAFT_1954106 [Baffinella frigidus]|nr:hypothetical protein T484DRAFT_1954106 [Cryptophyta sp. CCMP2293]